MIDHGVGVEFFSNTLKEWIIEKYVSYLFIYL